MFETTGIINQDILEELGKYIIPDVQRLPIKVVAVVTLIQGIINLSVMLLLSAVFFFLISLCYDAIVKRYYINRNVKQISEYICPNKCTFTTFFDIDGIHVTNHATGEAVTVPYTQVRKLVETKNCYFLWANRQFVVTFKTGLDLSEKEQFISYLRDKCPKVKVIVKTRRLQSKWN